MDQNALNAKRKRQETCLIVHPDLSLIRRHEKEGGIQNTQEQAIEEIEGLSKAINLKNLSIHSVKPKRLIAGHFLGKGQRENIHQEVIALEPDVLIFNDTLSPIQQRNLEKEWQVKVIDRTALILEIFADRAQTKEGSLQVELAMLDYQKSRLVRSWTHLERQRGGAGFMGGPGETQIEIDRRLISERITKLKKEMQTLKRTRDLGRQSRERVPFPIIALVGYTNAGKSTLFNRMTDSKVMAKDLLFATLDPTMRKFKLSNGTEAIMADTVGFISNLPTQLIAAFRSTLEQVHYADVILHVMDASREDMDYQRASVIEILKDMEIDYDNDPRIVEIYNKADVLSRDEAEEIERLTQHTAQSCMLSAVKGTGLEKLEAVMSEHISRTQQELNLPVPIENGAAMAWLYQNAQILDRKENEDKIIFKVRITPAKYGKFKQLFKISAS